MKKIIYTVMAFMTLGLSSCSDFLDETNRNSITSDVLYSTPDGYENLVNACYAYSRTFYGKADGCAFTEMGTDCYTGGGNSAGNVKAMAFYSNDLQGSYPLMQYMWDNLYNGLNCCNAAIARADKAGLDEATKRQRLGEVHFLRALYLHLITEIWGNVVLYTDEKQNVETVAKPSTTEQFYTQIFKDIDESISLLDGGAEKNNGRVTQMAAKALKARFCLYRKMYSEAASLAEDIIEHSGLSLYDKFTDTFSMANSKGQGNKEAIWWVDYNTDATLMKTFAENKITSPTLGDRSGNQSPLFSAMSYWMVSGCGVWVTPDTHAPWVQCMPTLSFLHKFNENIDQRYDGTFKGVWLVNSTSSNYSADYGPSYGASAPLQVGDTAFVVSKYVYTPEQRAQHHYRIFDANDVYDKETGKSYGTRDYFISTYKFHDNTNPTGWEYYSGRDFFVIRLAEMYLIAAEAEMMQGQKVKATTLINALRSKRAIPGHEAEMQISENDLDIDFILDERARELAQEEQRFFDLKRTGKLVERIKKYNPDAADVIKEWHQLRPVPQEELDAITNKNEFLQNEGYN